MINRAKQSFLTSFCATALLSFSMAAEARTLTLDEWFDKTLIPYVAGQLGTHPRFRDETVRYVILDNDNPQPVPTTLGLELLDRLHDGTAELPGVSVAWQATPNEITRSNRAAGIDCSASKVDYLIGLELRDGGQGHLNIRLRALDVAERSWVSGFSREWSGQLTRAQWRAQQQVEKDPSFRGERDVPFSVDQTDILALHLAHELGCMLLSEMSAEYSVAPDAITAAPLPLDAVIELVSNNLSTYRALQVTPDSDRANAVIEGKAHRIDGNLFQYWVTVKPKDAGTDVPSLSASAYVTLPSQYVAAVVEPEAQVAIWQSQADLFSSTRIVGVDSYQDCTGSNKEMHRATSVRGKARCYALQVTAKRDAVVFFLNQQPQHGLVRLAGRDCNVRTHAQVARQGQPLRLQIPVDTVGNVSWQPADGWDLSPDSETYIAIAVSDTKAARAIARQLQSLPPRCSSGMRPGLDGSALRAWTRELISITENWKTHIDWESVRVRNIY
ncbi:MAG: hypothetical protein KJO31_14435 [Gammaproteobacteria bacterium]|nr:hypothetical protein [Gammaproteobacteria bacterium]